MKGIVAVVLLCVVASATPQEDSVRQVVAVMQKYDVAVPSSFLQEDGAAAKGGFVVEADTLSTLLENVLSRIGGARTNITASAARDQERAEKMRATDITMQAKHMATVAADVVRAKTDLTIAEARVNGLGKLDEEQTQKVAAAIEKKGQIILKAREVRGLGCASVFVCVWEGGASGAWEDMFLVKKRVVPDRGAGARTGR